MARHHKPSGKANIFDIFTGLNISSRPQPQRIVRVSPEVDGICMLYSSFTNDSKLYCMKLLCWALRQDGSVDGMVPWFDGLRCCDSLYDPDIGQWEGYLAPNNDSVFFGPPAHKILELESAVQFFSKRQPQDSDDPERPLQEIPDTIGTHALLVDAQRHHLTLSEVISWRLNQNGTMQAMLADQTKAHDTPILPGASCLYPAESHPQFRYLFQHRIANQIKAEEPQAMEAIALLMKRLQTTQDDSDNSTPLTE
jgi:hypothetical protein